MSACRSCRPFGAIPVEEELVEFRVWAPASSQVCACAFAAQRPSARGGRRGRPRRRPSMRRTGTTTSSCSATGRCCPTRARASSRTGSEGPSRVVDTSRLRIAAGPGAAARRARALRDARRDVHFRRHVRRRDPAPANGCGASGVTALELMPVATFPGERGWGYDGVYSYAPHRGVRWPRRPRSARRRRASRGAGRRPRRRLQPHRARRRRRSARSGPYFTDRRRDLLGRRDRLRAARRARMGDPERDHVDARLPHRRAAARRGARDLRRRIAGARPARAARPGRRARHQRDGPRRLPAARGVGPRRNVARQPASRAARAPDRRARRLLRGVRLHRRGRARADAGPRPSGWSSQRRITTRSAIVRLGDRLPPRRAPRSLGDRAVLALDTAALHGRGARRARAVPVLHRSHRPVRSPMRRARGASASSRRSRRSPATEVARSAGALPPSSARGSRTGSRTRSTPSWSGCGASCRASSRSAVDGASADAPARQRDARRRLRGADGGALH